MPGETCRHAPCTCRLDGDAEFCSAACREDSAQAEMDDCNCGHDTCKTVVMQRED